jgi:hypothetical protein
VQVLRGHAVQGGDERIFWDGCAPQHVTRLQQQETTCVGSLKFDSCDRL